MSVAEMGTSLFAANEGYLRDVEVDKVLDFESALLSYMHSEHADFMQDIDDNGTYNDDVVATLHEAIKKFKETQSF
jgi:F-type H+-transporting ATPase subunit alpha